MKGFRAVTVIRWSPTGEEGAGVPPKEFAPGELVTGVPKEAMKGLWEAGALEEVEIAEPAAATPTGSTSSQGDPGSAPATGSGSGGDG